MKRLPSTVFFGQPNDTIETFFGDGCSRSAEGGAFAASVDVASRLLLTCRRLWAKKGLRQPKLAVMTEVFVCWQFMSASYTQRGVGAEVETQSGTSRRRRRFRLT